MGPYRIKQPPKSIVDTPLDEVLKQIELSIQAKDVRWTLLWLGVALHQLSLISDPVSEAEIELWTELGRVMVAAVDMVEDSVDVWKNRRAYTTIAFAAAPMAGVLGEPWAMAVGVACALVAGCLEFYIHQKERVSRHLGRAIRGSLQSIHLRTERERLLAQLAPIRAAAARVESIMEEEEVEEKAEVEVEVDNVDTGRPKRHREDE